MAVRYKGNTDLIKVRQAEQKVMELLRTQIAEYDEREEYAAEIVKDVLVEFRPDLVEIEPEALTWRTPVIGVVGVNLFNRSLETYLIQRAERALHIQNYSRVSVSTLGSDFVVTFEV